VDSSFGRAMGNAMVALVVLGILGGTCVGVCGTWAVQKASGYRIRIEKQAAPTPTPTPAEPVETKEPSHV
jgi:hypothetical protein